MGGPAGRRHVLPAAAAKPRMRDAAPGEGAQRPKGWSPCTRAPREAPPNPAEQHRIQTPALTHRTFTNALSHLPNSFCLPSGPSPFRHTLPSILFPLSFPPSLGFSAICEAVGEEIRLYSGKTEGQTTLLPGGATCAQPVWLRGVPSLARCPTPTVSPRLAHRWPRIHPHPDAPPASLPRSVVL